MRNETKIIKAGNGYSAYRKGMLVATLREWGKGNWRVQDNSHKPVYFSNFKKAETEFNRVVYV